MFVQIAKLYYQTKYYSYQVKSFLKSVTWHSDSTAFMIIVTRLLISFCIVVFTLLVLFFNWSNWLPNEVYKINMFNIIFCAASLSLVINIAHVKSMTRIYKLYSFIIFLFEFVLGIITAVFAFIFSLRTLIVGMFKESIVGGVVSIEAAGLTNWAYERLQEILYTPNGDIDTRWK